MGPIPNAGKAKDSSVNQNCGSREGPYCANFAAVNTRLHDCGAVGTPTFSGSDGLRAKDHSNPVCPEQGKEGGERSFTMAKRPKEEEGANIKAFRLGGRIVGADVAFNN